MKTELITIDEIDVPALFEPTPEGEEDKIDKLLSDIDQAVGSIVVNVNTLNGRKEIASIAAKIPRLKTKIDGVRLDIVSEEKKKLSEIDARGKRIKDGLDEIRTKFRQPLTEYEEKDKAIKSMREESINKLSAWLTDIQLTQDLDDLDRLLGESQELSTVVDWGDRQVEANEICYSISSAYASKKTQLLEAKRLAEENARLKREAEERAQKAREESIAREADEKRHKEELALALEAERAFQDTIKRQKEEQAKAREADKAHNNKIRARAVECMVEHGVPVTHARKAVAIIAGGLVDQIKITY